MYVCRYRIEKYVMNENKDKLSLMDGKQLPVLKIIEIGNWVNLDKLIL